MMTTSLPAVDLLTEGDPVGLREVLHRLVDLLKLAARDVEAGVGRADREDRVDALPAAGLSALLISKPVRKTVPSRSICLTRRSRKRFSILNSGMP